MHINQQKNKEPNNNTNLQQKHYYITVIIPCYNCESTIKRAIDSVINQSFGFENIELILYDDFSSDNTRVIINEYSKVYENIIPIFSEENSGFPGKGRNEGIKNATTDYIMFMDNDDKYDKDICKNLYQEITSEKCDLVSCNFLNINGADRRKSNYVYYFGEEKENKVIFYGNNTIYLSCRVVWACIFKKEIILKNNIWFPEDSLSEDVYFLSLYNLYGRKSIYIKEYIGIYRFIQEDSHSNSLNINRINRQYDTFEEILNIYEKINCDLSLVFGDVVEIYIYNLYNTGAIKEKNEIIYPILERLRYFEEKINFKKSKDPILNIAHKLILKKHYYWTKKYLILLSFIRKYNFMIKIYKNVFKS